MSRTFHHGERRIRARGIRQDPPDLRRIARALIALAEAQAEAEAQAQALVEDGDLARPRKPKSPKPRRTGGPGDAAGSV